MPRNEGGKACGKRVAATLSRYAAPVPIAIRVNMFGLRFTSDCHARTKKGQAPQITAGVARRNLSPTRQLAEKTGTAILSTSSPRSGTDDESAAPAQNRRVLISCSGYASPS